MLLAIDDQHRRTIRTARQITSEWQEREQDGIRQEVGPAQDKGCQNDAPLGKPRAIDALVNL
jgi:hypothetical protein